MKMISRVLVVFALLALTAGCASGNRGGIFSPGSGERILETTVKGAVVGTVIGGGVGILSEVFGGGDRGRDGVFVPGGYGGHGGWGHGGYSRGYDSGRAEAVADRRLRAAQREEESRRRDAIRAERAFERGRQDGRDDARRRW